MSEEGGAHLRFVVKGRAHAWSGILMAEHRHLNSGRMLVSLKIYVCREFSLSKLRQSNKTGLLLLI